MADLSVRRIPGIGKVNEMILSGLNIYKCKDLIAAGPALFVNFTERAFEFMMKSALGIGKTDHDTKALCKKSLSVCMTFKPTSDRSFI